MVRKGTEKPEGGADKILVLWRRGRQGETRVGKGLSRDLRQAVCLFDLRYSHLFEGDGNTYIKVIPFTGVRRKCSVKRELLLLICLKCLRWVHS